MGALEGCEDVADVGDAHAGDVFEEGDEGDELGVVGGAGPWGEDDGIGWLEGGVFGGGVEDEGAGEGPVEVVEILDWYVSWRLKGKEGKVGGGRGHTLMYSPFLYLVASRKRGHITTR